MTRVRFLFEVEVEHELSELALTWAVESTKEAMLREYLRLPGVTKASVDLIPGPRGAEIHSVRAPDETPQV